MSRSGTSESDTPSTVEQHSQSPGDTVRSVTKLNVPPSAAEQTAINQTQVNSATASQRQPAVRQEKSSIYCSILGLFKYRSESASQGVSNTPDSDLVIDNRRHPSRIWKKLSQSSLSTVAGNNSWSSDVYISTGFSRERD